eukprot:TRINITY_DN74472_c0_g1_i1.p1 TRINITY_DN74472_c0_g1~~TRINITY_DN74472_c0_g1_i1.p1  ORF type:complete len:426 (-),score=83.66 TRINITY_DN74472_c0_g1_i1:104-1381(-)
MGSGAQSKTQAPAERPASGEERPTAAPERETCVRAEVAQVARVCACTTPMSESAKKLLDCYQAWEQNKLKFYGWLTQIQEEVLEPDLEIVDPHHHAWDMRKLQGYNFMGILKQQYYMTDELVDDFVFGGHNVVKTCYAEAHSFISADLKESGEPVMASLGEVVFAQGLAAQFESGTYGSLRACAGIIGSADIAKYGADVEPLLIACKGAAKNFRGVRVSAAHDPSLKAGNFAGPQLLAEQKFREGIALFEKHDLVLDCWVFSCQILEVVDLAKAFPGITIVLDHNGTPVGALGNHFFESGHSKWDKQAEVVAQWKEDMRVLAEQCPNVYVKVGAAALPHLGHGFDKREKPPTSDEVAELFQDTYLWTIQTFGADRCMFEGNFPVDKVSMSYTVLWNAYKKMTKALPEAQRSLLFSGTAKKVYKLQ